MKKSFAVLLAALLLIIPVRAVQPDAPVSRGAFVQALWELWGSVPYEDTRVFSDLAHDAPYTTAVCWAHDLALILGVGEGCFEPERPITREEAAVFLRRAAAHIGRETATISNLAMCNDYADISPWADDSLYWATESGLIDWDEGGLRAPYGTITADEMAGIYQRFAHP
jgi:hypothetical protein